MSPFLFHCELCGTPTAMAKPHDGSRCLHVKREDPDPDRPRLGPFVDADGWDLSGVTC